MHLLFNYLELTQLFLGYDQWTFQKFSYFSKVCDDFSVASISRDVPISSINVQQSLSESEVEAKEVNKISDPQKFKVMFIFRLNRPVNPPFVIYAPCSFPCCYHIRRLELKATHQLIGSKVLTTVCKAPLAMFIVCKVK